MKDSKQPCAVYRAYDATGEFLYVGIANDWGARWAQHAERSPFFSIVARLEVSWFPTRTHARAEELRLLADHNPPFNTRGRTDGEEEEGQLHLVCLGCGIGIYATKESLADFWKKSCLAAVELWPDLRARFSGGTTPRCSEQLRLRRVRAEALYCSRCGCFYGGSLEYDGYFKFRGGPCRDHRCRCGGSDCYPKHTCDGVLKRPSEVPNARELQLRAWREDEARR